MHLSTCVGAHITFLNVTTSHRESQSQWFGKAGISFHVSHALFKKAGKQLQHTLGHLNDEAKQVQI